MFNPIFDPTKGNKVIKANIVFIVQFMLYFNCLFNAIVGDNIKNISTHNTFFCGGGGFHFLIV